ncbi:13327_t:CDS:2 [Funneliformis caledonium]|uniref:13327_t:CDS:1 n=1 Tax=Funneliformis caledonium TaxID=1117310 RepID=A0A9N9CGK5_9GLOM|nr:13327_t:CDS:2 [Funneliformis caledonium]
MPLSHASRLVKKRVVKQKHDKMSKFKLNKRYKDDNDDYFILELSDSDDFYSEDSDSDSEEFLDQRMQCLSEFKLGSFTIAVKGISSLFNFFKPMKDLAENKLVVDLTDDINDDISTDIKDNNNVLADIKDDNNALISAKDDNNVLVGTKGNNNALVGTKDDNNIFADARDDDSSAGIKDDDLLAKGDSETGFLDD